MKSLQVLFTLYRPNIVINVLFTPFREMLRCYQLKTIKNRWHGNRLSYIR